MIQKAIKFSWQNLSQKTTIILSDSLVDDDKGVRLPLSDSPIHYGHRWSDFFEKRSEFQSHSTSEGTILFSTIFQKVYEMVPSAAITASQKFERRQLNVQTG